MKNVFVIENHPLMFRSLVESIQREADLTVCGRAETPNEAFASIVSLQPDVVLAQIPFEPTKGVELIQRLRAHSSALPIIGIAAFDFSPSERAARSAGATAVAFKHEGPAKLIETIRAVLRAA